MTDEFAADGRAAIRAVHATFLAAGLAWTSWVARIPQVRDALGLDAGELGLLLLAGSLGSFCALPFAGALIERIGAARSVRLMAAVCALGIATVAIGHRIGIPITAVGLFAFGVGGGMWDVAMNVEAAAVERRAGRSIMARFHASFSIGTVCGAAIGAACIALGFSVTANLIAVAVLAAGGAIAASHGFLPRDTGQSAQSPRGFVRRAWREPRTLLIGAFVFCAAFTEGSGSDWIAVALIDGHGASAVQGALGFGCFVAMMTVSRIAAPTVLDRFGRVASLRAFGAIALAGVALLTFGDSAALAIAGCAIWGVGISLGFPVAMSAASDDPRRAAARVSVVATVGYTAFIAGPPSIGLLARHVGILNALVSIMALLAIGALLAAATRPQD